MAFGDEVGTRITLAHLGSLATPELTFRMDIGNNNTLIDSNLRMYNSSLYASPGRLEAFVNIHRRQQNEGVLGTFFEVDRTFLIYFNVAGGSGGGISISNLSYGGVLWGPRTLYTAAGLRVGTDTGTGLGDWFSYPNGLPGGNHTRRGSNAWFVWPDHNAAGTARVFPNKVYRLNLSGVKQGEFNAPSINSYLAASSSRVYVTSGAGIFAFTHSDASAASDGFTPAQLQTIFGRSLGTIRGIASDGTLLWIQASNTPSGEFNTVCLRLSDRTAVPEKYLNTQGNNLQHFLNTLYSYSGGLIGYDARGSRPTITNPTPPTTTPTTAPGIPVGLSGIAADGIVTLSWAATDGATAYDLRYRIAGSSNTHTTIEDITSTGRAVSGLNNGTTYEFSVRAKNAQGESDWSPVRRYTPKAPVVIDPPPPIPTGLALTQAVRSTVLTWTASTGAIAYIFRYRPVGNDDDPWTVRGDQLPFLTETIDNLDPGVQYEFQVRAVGRTGRRSDYSASVRITPSDYTTSPANAPTNVKHEVVGIGQVSLVWDAVDRANFYVVQWRTGQGFYSSANRKRTRGTETSIRITGLHTTGDAVFQVRAENNIGFTAWSFPENVADMSLGIPLFAPQKPAPPAAVPEDTALDIIWTFDPQAESYNLRYREKRSAEVVADITRLTGLGPISCGNVYDDANVVRWDFPTILGGTTFPDDWFANPATADKVPLFVAIRATGQLVLAGINLSTKLSISAIANLKISVSETEGNNMAEHTGFVEADRIADGRYIITTADADGFQDVFSQNSSFLNVTFSDARGPVDPSGPSAVLPWNTVENITESGYVIRDLVNLTNYEIQIQAVNRVGRSAWSESFEARPMSPEIPAPVIPPPDTAPPTPGTFDGYPGNEQVLLSWREAPRSSSYHVRYRILGTSAWTEEDDIVGEAFTIEGLINGTPYEFGVQASNAFGDSDWTDSIVRTPVAPTVAPGAPVATATAGNGQVIIDIATPVEGADSYQIRHKKTADQDYGPITTYGFPSFPIFIEGLENTVPYSFQVRSKNAAGESGWNTYTATPITFVTIPDIPENLRAIAGNRQVTLYYDDPNGGGQVQFRYRFVVNRVPRSWTSTAKLTQTPPYTITGLSNNVLYQVQMRAWAGASAVSDWGPIVEFTPHTGVLTFPVLGVQRERRVIVKFQNDDRGLCSGHGVLTLPNNEKYRGFKNLSYDPYIQVTSEVSSNAIKAASIGTAIQAIFPTDESTEWAAARSVGERVIANFLERDEDNPEWTLTDHGFIGLLDAVERLDEALFSFRFMPVLERITKQDPEIWSDAAHQSRVPDDKWFGDLGELAERGRYVKFP